MPTIIQTEQIIQYTAAPVLISTLPYLANIKRISRVSPNGNGYVSVLPTSAFPPFAWLETGEFYIFSSLETGYTVDDDPNATVTEAAPIFSNDFFAL